MFDEYYSGCTLLKPLSDKIGIQIDRLNFVICQFTALCFAFLMRRYLHPSTTSANVRHYFSFLVGISLSYFCFGNEIAHLLIVSTICCVIMKFQDPKTMQNSVFIVSVGYLAVCHIKRIIYNYGAYNLDITGPLMVLVQRVSGLAFSLHDGLACDVDKLSPFRKQYITEKKPSLIEYYGYLFQFQSILAGPNILFKDYVQFIDGSNFKNSKFKDASSEPAVAHVVLRKIIVSITCIIIHLGLAGYVPIEFAKKPIFWYEYGPAYQMIYLLICTTLTRFMYYHAWILAEAVCNASGLGFNGFDKEGNAKWDLAKNVDILGFEFADNIRNAIASWNTGTNAWLRFLVYERMEKYQSYKTVATFMLSAVWHGFYPGYYLCFVTAALLVSAARAVRKFVRPYFLGSKSPKLLYDIATFIVTKLAVAYFTFPFVMYDFWPAVITYRRMFFFIHIGCVLAMFLLPTIRRYFPKPPVPVVN